TVPVFSIRLYRPPLLTLFPYTTLFRSSRYYTTDNLVFEFKSSAFFVRLIPNMNMSILSTSTRLTNEFTFYFSRSSECFAVSNLWRTNICFHFKFTLQAIYDYIQM